MCSQLKRQIVFCFWLLPEVAHSISTDYCVFLNGRIGSSAVLEILDPEAWLGEWPGAIAVPGTGV